MSETAVINAPVTSQEAPAGPVAPTVNPPPTVATEGPKTAVEFLTRVRKGEAAKPATPPPSIAAVVNASGRTIDPVTKQFVATSADAAPAPSPVTAGAPAQVAAPTPEAAAAAPAQGTPTEPAAPAPEFVKIPLPEGHPLRAKGKDHLVFPKDEEQYGRWAVQEAVRRADLQAANTARDEAAKRALTLEAEATFWRDQGAQIFGPEFKQRYEDIEKTYGKDAAEDYKAGVLAKANQSLDAKRQEVTEAADVRAETEKAERFASYAAQHARQRYPLWNLHQFKDALASYASYIGTRGAPAHMNSWQSHADALYQQDPRVQTDIRTRSEQQRAAEIERLASERANAIETQRLAAYQQGRRTNPLGAMPSIATDRTVPSQNSDKPKSAPEFLKQVRRGAVHGTRQA